LIGEDETQAKNRFALICSNCRLVNGQAPPGTKSLEDVGKWRCSACKTMNGEESEATKVIKEVTKLAEKEPDPTSEPLTKEENDIGDVAEADEDESGHSSSGVGADDDDGTPAKSTRSKTKGGKKGRKK
jgi:hypothetical protein